MPVCRQFRSNDEFEPGEQVELRVFKRGLIQAEVRWVRDDRVARVPGLGRGDETVPDRPRLVRAWWGIRGGLVVAVLPDGHQAAARPVSALADVPQVPR